MATWQQLIDRVKLTLGMNASTDSDHPDTVYDAVLLEIVNAVIRPEVRGVLLDPDDSGWLETAPSYINIVAGTDRYTPDSFDAIRSLSYKEQTSDTKYIPLDYKPQLRNVEVDAVTPSFNSFEGFYLSGESFVVRWMPGVSITNGFRIVIVPRITDAALADTVDIPATFHDVLFYLIRYELANIKGIDNRQLMKTYTDDRLRALEGMAERAHDRVSMSRQVIISDVAGSDGLVSY